MFALSPARAENIFVEYRGLVNISKFSCEWVTRSSFVNRVCYDQRNAYMVILLNNNYYHYCRIGASVVNELRFTDSMGRFYNRQIKGNYDCRLGGVPQ